MNIYTCYSRNDSQKVLEVCNQLKELGISDIFGPEQLSFGEEFALSLKNKIVTSDYILFFYSEEAEKSVWIRREIEYALSYKKKIITILLSECPADSWYNELISTNLSINAYKGLTNVTSHILSLIDSDKQSKDTHKTYNRVDYCPQPILSNGRPTSLPLPKRSKKRQRIIVISIILAVIGVSFFTWIFMNRQITLENKKIINESVTKQATNQQDSIIIELEQRLKYEIELLENDRTNYPTKPKSSESTELSRQQILARERELRYQLELLEMEKRKVSSITFKGRLNSSESTESSQPQQNFNYNNTHWGWIATVFLLLIICVLTIIITIVARTRNGRKKSTVIIKCFIAGSKALQTERDALRSVISLMYNKWENKSFRILSYTYEDFEKQVIRGGHQAKYNRFIREEASWVLFIID